MMRELRVLMTAVVGVGFGGAAFAHPAAAQDASRVWNDPRARALVELATRRRAQQLADTSLRDYQADAQGYVTFLVQLGKGFIEIPKVVKVDQFAVEVYWKAPNLSKQRIIGMRDTTLVATDIRYHRDHLGIVQNNFPDLIRLGEGDEVRDVPHPLSGVGLREYDFAIGDSLRIGISGRQIWVVEVKVRPKNDRQPRVIGAVFIDPLEGQVVRMAFNFTRAAFLDEALEDLAIVLENQLVGTRFWLPRKQEVEIRRTGTYLDIPVRGVIRGRWEIGNYRVNLEQPPPPTFFAGTEFVQASPTVLAAYPWKGGVLDALPADVRQTTDADIMRVQAEARALVRAKALERPQRLVIAAPGISQFVRANRVEGIALGSGLRSRVGAAISVDASARYGISDRAVKWDAGLTWERPSRSGVRLFARHDFRDVGDVQERSVVANSLASQEVGSDFTDPYEVLAAGLRAEWRMRETLALTFEGSAERQRPLAVHAVPVAGAFDGVFPADSLSGVRVAARLERPATPWIRGTDLALGVELRGQVMQNGSVAGDVPLRLSTTAEITRAFGTRTLRSWTFGAFSLGSRIPFQERIFLGGPITAPGYRFHSLSGDGALAQRIELQTPIPFPRIPLGRFGKTGNRAILAPYLHVAALDVRHLPEWRHEFDPSAPISRHATLSGVRPSAGLALIAFYDLLRIDVARGLRGGVWTLNVDVSRGFWSIL